MIGWKPSHRNMKVAGYRYRCLRVIEGLKKLGIEAELFEPEHEYDIVVFAKQFYDDSFIEAKRLKNNGTLIVFDCYDNYIYLRDKTPEWKRVRDLVLRMMHLSDIVTVPSEQMRSIICNSVRLNTPVKVIEDILEYPKCDPVRHNHSTVKVIWHGNAGSPGVRCGMSDLNLVKDILHRIHMDLREIELKIISNNMPLYREIFQDWEINVIYEEWSYDKFIDSFRENDICIIPISQNPFTICKNHSRLANSFLLGLPVVADSIPAYELFDDCAYLNNWEEGLTSYIEDPELGVRHVLKGQEKASELWNNDKIYNKWRSLFRSLM